MSRVKFRATNCSPTSFAIIEVMSREARGGGAVSMPQGPY